MISTSEIQEKKGCLIKRLTKQILDKIKQENKDIDLSFTDINYFDPSVVQGNNFIAKLSHTQNSNSTVQRMGNRESRNLLGEEPIGVGLYFQEKQEDNQKYFDVFIGQIVNGKNQGPGIRMQIYLKLNQKKQNEPNSTSQQIMNSRPIPKFTTQKHRVLYLEDWSLVDPLIDRTRQGIYYYKDGVQEQTFKGLFVNQQIYKKGQLTIKSNGSIKSVYTGNFNEKNQAHGYGQLLVPGQYKYKGEYCNNRKHGFGQEKDFCRFTRYVGDFYDNQKEGYGELTYGMTFGKKKENNAQNQGKEEKQKRKKVKGYWKNGVAIGGKAVIVDEKQNASEVLQSHHYKKSPEVQIQKL